MLSLSIIEILVSVCFIVGGIDSTTPYNNLIILYNIFILGIFLEAFLIWSIYAASPFSKNKKLSVNFNNLNPSPIEWFILNTNAEFPFVLFIKCISYKGLLGSNSLLII